MRRDRERDSIRLEDGPPNAQQFPAMPSTLSVSEIGQPDPVEDYFDYTAYAEDKQDLLP